MPFKYQADHQIYRLDYTAPNFKVSQFELTFDLHKEQTTVTTRFILDVLPEETLPIEVKLHGSNELLLKNISINSNSLNSSELIFDNNDLILVLESQSQVIEIINTINPSSNTELSGLYLSNGIFCSDCEPQGFRNITYFPDRPDIMTTYKVTLIADQSLPVLLSNGNLLEEGLLEDNRHYAIWEDPFPKPTYLFAIVAGDLAFIEGEHIRPDGTPVRLRVYASETNIPRCDFALKSLKKAMKWDEKRFGLVCDLDYYNIVAVDDFNGGAMENKGLNLFNTSCILATPETATDSEFNFVEAVVGHEYFHNWTGNRITCQDWFNLSLKEGLTVFREQAFIADEQHPGIRRIEDVNFLRVHQFPHDQGPLSHAVRPDTLGAVENIYTTTTYEKGAEIIRLYQTILGEEGFDKGFQRYIQEFDGMAVTVEDFFGAMKAENPRLFDTFPLWYSQRGTPVLKVATTYDADKKELRLSLKQFLHDPITHELLKPMPIPVKYALFSQKGECLLEEIFTITTDQQCLVFHNIEEMPVISLLRDFSAPVIVDYEQTLSDLKVLIAHETDYFAKWQAMQTLITRAVLRGNQDSDLIAQVIGDAFEPLFEFAYEDPGFCALLLTMPEEGYFLSLMETEDILAFGSLRKDIEIALATRFENQWLKLYSDFQDDSVFARSIKNIALQFLSFLDPYQKLITEQFYNSQNMTDISAALKYAIWGENPDAKRMIDDFYNRYQSYPTLVDRWFSLLESNPNLTYEMLMEIVDHPAFNLSNPNRARAIVGAVGKNRYALARIGAPLYEWIAQEILVIDKINSVTAARLVTPFTKLTRLPEPLQLEVRAIIESMLKAPNISNNLFDQLKRII